MRHENLSVNQLTIKNLLGDAGVNPVSANLDVTNLRHGGVVDVLDTAGALKRRIDYVNYNAAPTVDTWRVGDIVYFHTPVAAGNIGAVCVTAGTPGTWKTFGAIAA